MICIGVSYSSIILSCRVFWPEFIANRLLTYLKLFAQSPSKRLPSCHKIKDYTVMVVNYRIVYNSIMIPVVAAEYKLVLVGDSAVGTTSPT